MTSILSQDGGKISRCADLRSRNDNYNVLVFKTIQDVHGWVGTLILCSPLFAVGFLFRQVLYFNDGYIM